MRELISALKQTKWWWHLPFVFLFILPTISRWIMEPEKAEERMPRLIVSEYMIPPTILYIFILAKIVFVALGIKI